MVKLATARESRMYGPRPARHRWEYINAGLYVFAAILLLGGFASQLSYRGDAQSGLLVLLVALAIVFAVNAHDLVAHMAGIDYRFALLSLDAQLALVEFAAPLVQALGTALQFTGILLLFIQRQRGYSDRLEKNAVGMFVAGPAMWVVGSIHNVCQVYERADGHVQVLQKCVQVPFLMGSLLFLVGGAFNSREVFGRAHRAVHIAGKTWAWLSLFGSLFFLVGGLLNVVKVFKMQQMDGVRLEKLRGGAQERLIREREGQVPLILEESRRREGGVARPVPPPVSTPYKDVLVGRS